MNPLEGWAQMHPDRPWALFQEAPGCQYYETEGWTPIDPCNFPTVATVTVLCKTCGERSFRVCLADLERIVPLHDAGYVPLYCGEFAEHHAVAAIMGFDAVA